MTNLEELIAAAGRANRDARAADLLLEGARADAQEARIAAQKATEDLYNAIDALVVEARDE